MNYEIAQMLNELDNEQLVDAFLGSESALSQARDTYSYIEMLITQRMEESGASRKLEHE